VDLRQHLHNKEFISVKKRGGWQPLKTRAIKFIKLNSVDL